MDIMPARVSWYDQGKIILFSIRGTVTVDEIDQGAEEVWALAAEVREPVDLIFDYREMTNFPRGIMPSVREGHFKLPTLQRVALVGHEPLIEMMMTTITRTTFRPDPTIHDELESAAERLRQTGIDAEL
jgi:hypothetical protein